VASRPRRADFGERGGFTSQPATQLLPYLPAICSAEAIHAATQVKRKKRKPLVIQIL
jgi:hypothetical protein